MYRLNKIDSDKEVNPIEESFVSEESENSSMASVIKKSKRKFNLCKMEREKVIAIIIGLLLITVTSMSLALYLCNKRYKQNNLDLTAKLSNLTAENFMVKNDLNKYQQDTKNLISEKNLLETKYETLTNENEKTKKKIYELNQELNQMKDSYTKTVELLTKEKKDLENELNSQDGNENDSRIKELESKLKEKETELAKIGILISEYNEKNKLLENTVNELKAQIAQNSNIQTNNCAEIQKEYEEKIKTLSFTIENLRRNSALCDKQNAKYISQLSVCQSENSKIKSELTNIKKEQILITQDNSRLLNEINKLQYTNKAYLDNINQLHSESSSLISSLIHSTIIQTKNDFDHISSFIGSRSPISLSLLYKATIHGDSKSSFEKRVDGTTPTLILIQIEDGTRFGGYTTEDWKPVNKFLKFFGKKFGKIDKSAFMFNLDTNKKFVVKNNNNAIAPDYSNVLTFGDNDLTIVDKFFRSESKCDFPKSYQGKNLELTNGRRTFKVREIEVFRVQFGD